MADDVVIRAEGLGKKYMIGHQSNERYTALRDVIARSARNFGRAAGDMMRGRPIYGGDKLEEFWALKGVDFEIERGDVVGIIGRNGAGKSTLLKVLSRITEPTEGRVEIKGRVASLLEVGTGFHPELTGRENIYLNGAILGMTRTEIVRKFDEIVDFSGVEKFLDTPVKRYSSGMYVRLAFAVAAHLEPEILIVDEVLAVGDAEFQRKCFGRMENISKSGRTVLLVSHNLGTIKNICNKGLLVSSGTIALAGDAEQVVSKYLQSDTGDKSSYSGNRIRVSFSLVETLHNGSGAIIFVAEGTLEGGLSDPIVGIGINDNEGNRLATIFSDAYGSFPRKTSATKFRICSEPFRPVGSRLHVKLGLSDGLTILEASEGEVSLSIPEYMPFSQQPRANATGNIYLNGSIECLDS